LYYGAVKGVIEMKKNKHYGLQRYCYAKTLLFVAIAFILSGCATMFTDVKITKAIEEKRIYVGMTMDEAMAVIGRKPLVAVDKLSGEKKEDGTYAEWSINGGGMGGNLMGTYTLVFKDGKLIEWRYSQ